MLREARRHLAPLGILAAIAGAVLSGSIPVKAAEPPPKPLKSGVVTFEEAKAH